MKVLLFNGSPKENGCTFTALSEIAETLNNEGVATEIFHVGNDAIQSCIDCRHCREVGKCVFENDVVSAALEKAREADGFVFGSPVYYAAASGQITSFMNRLFFSSKGVFTHKPGAAVVCCRRAGSTAALEQLNKYFVISQMLLVGSQYWPMAHGNTPDEIRQDLEGLQTMRVLGRNLAWVMKCLNAGKESGIQLPAAEDVRHWTNFIR